MSKKKVKTNETINKENIIAENYEMKNFIIIMLSIIVVFFLFYFITVWVKYEVKNHKPVEETVTINYDKILLGNILNENGKYYVLATYKDDNYEKLYTSYLNSTKEQYYISDLSDGFNSKFLSDKSNLKVTKITDLKVSTATLFYINNKKIVNVYEGKEQILEYLSSKVK